MTPGDSTIPDPIQSKDGANAPDARSQPLSVLKSRASRVSGLIRETREKTGGSLIVVEGPDGSGRSTQIALLTEWLESNGFAVETMGLRRSNLLARNIDSVLAKNNVGRLTLALMYATDFFDQLENIMIPALRAGYVVLADRYIYTLIARSAVRGINEDYLFGIYELALKPDLTFWLNISPKSAFEREFKKSQVISYWESGRDMVLGNDLFESFIQYQTLLKRQYDRLHKRFGFVMINGEPSVRMVNRELRKKLAAHLGIGSIRYTPSDALIHLMR